MILGKYISNIRNLALIFGILLVLSLCVVGGFLMLAYENNAYTESKAAIDADIRGLSDIYTLSNNPETIKRIIDRRLDKSNISSFYKLLDHQGQQISGNLSDLPDQYEEHDEGYYVYEIPYDTVPRNVPEPRDPFYKHYDVLVKTVGLGNGEISLTVGRDVDAFQTSQNVIVGLAWITGLIVLLIALIGFLVALMIFRRMRLIHLTSTKVMETGNLSLRIPENEATGDFKPLARTFNDMLERIENLVAGIRQVSDNIAHDLRTPLTRLQNNIEELQAGKSNKSLEDLSSETSRIISTFNALLRIAKIEHGDKADFKFSKINLNHLLEDIFEYYEVISEVKNQKLSLSIEAQLPDIRGDRDLLFQAFSNIIENAIKFTPENGPIKIEATRNSSGFVVRITDRGVGILESEQSKVFQRFYRTETSRHTPGNGLGLSLVKVIFDMHGAEIELSQNTPSGLIFSISFSNLTKC